MNFKIFYSKLLRLPIEKAVKLLGEYQETVGFKDFAEQQRALDLLTNKTNINKMVKKDVIEESTISMALAISLDAELGKEAFESLKELPMVLWIELIGVLRDNEIVIFLQKYGDDLPSSLVETCIINASDSLQCELIKKYKDRLDTGSEWYDSFYYAVSEEVRNVLDIELTDGKKNNILLLLNDIEEKNLLSFIADNKDELSKVHINHIMEVVLLKTISVSLISSIIELLKDRMVELDDDYFEIMFTRYIYLRDHRHRFDDYSYYYEDEELIWNNSQLLELFKENFKKIGLLRTLSLFEAEAGYDGNELGERIIYSFMDEAYDNEELKPFVNDVVVEHLIKKFNDDCQKKEYTKSDFYSLVDKIDVTKCKIFYDDFIEAMIACGKLMKTREINDKDEYFIRLREMFIKRTYESTERDGTYEEDVNLNGVFYRLVKGALTFDKFYLVKTYKGILYLAKSGSLVDNADFVTKFLSDWQVANLNISPLLRWKKAKVDENLSKDSISFFERMGLQLLCYFGELRAKHILDSGVKGNRMESLFDGLRYKDIQLDSKGNAIVNIELLNFLFGKGSVRESQSVMNRLLRGEIEDFKKCFVDLCNDYENVLHDCNGILSVKRVVRRFEDIKLPIELKPDQLHYKKALKEVSTVDAKLLSRAVELCDAARKRRFSTIPKVEGSLGDFTYEVLDLGDPLAVAVGYMSHCCFKVDGISKKALEHSMTSVNGRIFVVYYKGKFLAQSWIWRNGDVICFDSIEAGSALHGVYNDDINLLDVYKHVAAKMIQVSRVNEDDIQRVKVVTVGNSDFRFEGLTKVEGSVPRPLEKDVYVYDSMQQNILGGSMPEIPRYGEVGVQYQDPRGKVRFIKEVKETDVDTLDDVLNTMYSVRYRYSGDIVVPQVNDYRKIVAGDDWFITVDNYGTVDYVLLEDDERAYEEFRKYAVLFNISLNKSSSCEDEISLVKLPKKGGN